MEGTLAGAEPLTNAEAARLRVLLLAQAVFIVTVAAIAGLGGALLAAAFPAETARLVTWPTGPVKLSHAWDSLFGQGSAARIAIRLPWLVAGMAGALLGWRIRNTVRRAADLFFPPLDTELLRPVRRAGALDPLWAPADPKLGDGMQPLDWVEPPPPNGEDSPTPRRRIWEGLLAFLSEEVGDGRLDLFSRPRVPMGRFRWLILTGQPGSGKTRMALELARGRARRDAMGDPAENLPPELKRAHLRARAALRRGAWWRLAIPWAARRERPETAWTYRAPWQYCDPWDAWWLVGANVPGRPSHGQRGRFDPALLKRLAAWRPRRPTVLLLDDPLEGDAGSVVTALLEGEARFRHPVRLLVVSQTVPTDLDVRERSGSWVSELRGFAGDILRFGGDAGLVPAEVRVMAGSLHRRTDELYRKQPVYRHHVIWTPDTASVDRLLRRTAGNALLVGLALHRIYRHPEQPEASRQALLRERVEQIVAALEIAGVDSEALLAIAAATLAGPGAVLPPTAVGTETRFDPGRLVLVPNLHHMPAPAPPLVLPEPIGEAFVHYVLDEKRCAGDRRQRVVDAAWQAAPAVMLRNSWRLSIGDDAVARIMRAGPPPAAGLSELDIALTYAQWAVQIPRVEWDVGDVPGPTPFPPLPAGYHQGAADPEEIERFSGLRSRADEALRLGLEHLKALPPPNAAAALPRFVSLLEVDSSYAVIRQDAALICCLTLIARGQDGETEWKDTAAAKAAEVFTRFLVALWRWGVVGEDRTFGGLSGIRELIRRAGPAPDADGIRSLENLAGAAWELLDLLPEWSAAIFDALAAWALGGGTMGAAHARCYAAAAACRRDPAAAANAAAFTDDIAHPFRGDLHFEYLRATAWRYVAGASEWEPPACETAARRVDCIARPFAGDSMFELERAQAWGYLCRALKDPAECEAAARQVEDIARPFPGNPVFELERARAWRYVAFVRDDPAACETAARRVDDIGRHFPGNPNFERERVHAWRYVVSARAGWADPIGCEAAARLVDDIARPFPGNRVFEGERGRAWGAAGYAYAQRENSARSEALARRVDDIVRLFSSQVEIAFPRAAAWRYVGLARWRDPVGSKAAARRVDEIASPFPGNWYTALECARAWRYVAYARTEGLAGCDAAARRVDEIARDFAGDPQFELERATAWRHVTYASWEDPVGSEAAARLVDDIARPFFGLPHFDRFERERATAWRHVSYARRKDSAGCEAAARRVR